MEVGFPRASRINALLQTGKFALLIPTQTSEIFATTAPTPKVKTWRTPRPYSGAPVDMAVSGPALSTKATGVWSPVSAGVGIAEPLPTPQRQYLEVEVSPHCAKPASVIR